MYVDRIVHCRRTVIRAWPTIKGWTTKKLQERQALELKTNMFGIGSLENPLNKDEYLQGEECRKQQRDAKLQHGECSRKESSKLEDEWSAACARIADSIEDWIRRLKQLPADVMEEDRFKLAIKIGKKLLGVIEQNVSEDVDIGATLTQAKDQEEEYSTQWIADMEKMMQAYDVVQTIDEKPNVHFEDYFRNDNGGGINRSPEALHTNNNSEEGPSSPKGDPPELHGSASTDANNNETANDQPEHEDTNMGEASHKGKCCKKTSNVQV